ncbi:hypothetical protein KBC55_01915 [Patescibacteria group bacterium]|nr:hypothetical protein [Patescibacteria group bacterium]
MPTDPLSVITLIAIATTALIDAYLMRHAVTYYLKAQKHAGWGDPWRREKLHRDTSWRYVMGIIVTTLVGAAPYILLKVSAPEIVLP